MSAFGTLYKHHENGQMHISIHMWAFLFQQYVKMYSLIYTSGLHVYSYFFVKWYVSRLIDNDFGSDDTMSSVFQIVNHCYSWTTGPS